MPLQKFRLSHGTDALTIALMLMMMALLLGPLLFQPNDYLFATGGDGLKNYFTPSWTVRYDQGLHFKGMNHPWGEHLTYTDAQPLLALTLRGLDHLGLALDGRVPGVLNLLMMLSLIPAALLIRRLGTFYGLPTGWAIWLALITAMLSPQVHRWQGHYALGYVCFVPLLWWLVIRIENALPGKRNRWTMLLCLGLLAFGLLHLYYLLIGLAMLGSYAAVRTFWQPRYLGSAIRLLAAAGMAFIAVLVFIQWSDGIGDRPEAPYGLTAYRASVRTVFFAAWSPFLAMFRRWGQFPMEQYEGLGYVGLPGVLAVLVLLIVPVVVFWRWLRESSSRVNSSKVERLKTFWSGLSGREKSLLCWTGSAVFLLLLAMAIPFRLGKGQWLDYMAVLKQFRSPGRLVFVFYHVWTVFSAVLFFRLSRLAKTRRWQRGAMAVLGLLFLAWSWEATLQLQRFRRSVTEHNVLSASTFVDLFREQGLDAGGYQAVLTLPYYHMGSEKLYIDKGSGALHWGMQLAYQTGVPLLNVMMSRTSLSQTISGTSLVSRYGPVGDVLTLLDERPVLVFCNRSFDHPSLSDRERALLLRARPLYAGPDYSLGALMPHELSEDVMEWPEDYPSGILYTQDFEQGSEMGLIGKAAYRASGPWELATVPVKPSWAQPLQSGLPVDTMVLVSVWCKAYLSSASFPNIRLDWLASDSTVLWSGYVITKQSLDVQPGWVEARRVLEPMPEAAYLRVTAEGVDLGLDRLRICAIPQVR